MSFNAYVALTEALDVTAVEQALKQIPSRQRPGAGRVVAVAYYLADKFQDKRFYVDESISQISEATGITPRSVRTVLGVLDDLGLWTISSAGNRYKSSRRVPGFLRREPDSREPGKTVPVDVVSKILESRGLRSREPGIAGASTGATAHPRNPLGPPYEGGQTHHEPDPDFDTYGIGPDPCGPVEQFRAKRKEYGL